MKRIAILAVVLLAGCFDSLLGTPCRDGYVEHDRNCIAEQALTTDAGMPGVDGDDQPPVDAPPATPDAMTDAMADSMPDAGSPDAPVCTAIPDDPLNCGACGHVCTSGICSGDTCAGEIAGHVVAIGHDFTVTNAGVLRVLGNAAAMGLHHDLAIARWGESSAVTAALAASLAQLGRPWHAAALPAQPASDALANVDVVVIDPRTGDGDASELEGASWHAAFAALLSRGGVVIVLEGASGTNYRFASGAGLFTTTAPVAVTGSHLAVVAATDAIAQQVPSPYLAASASVAFPGLTAVVATPEGQAVVSHIAVP